MQHGTQHSVDTGAPEDADDQDELAVGTVLGSYRIRELLGAGGMGLVYVAEHMRLGRRVALKVLRKSYAANPVAVARFFDEARAVNRISHEHIVEITDFFENPGGANYFIMELLRGEDLAHVLQREGPLPVSRVVEIARQIASVLAAVHEAQIIHRDLKPDNVFLIHRGGTNDFVKLLDFGVAKLSEQLGPIKASTTAVGSIIGTPEYMSPEQASGEIIDHRSDIYSLGVIMYEMLTGVSPFKGKNFGEVLVKHLTLEPRPLATFENAFDPIPGAVEALVMSLLAKDREQRPQSMAEVEEALQGILDYVAPVVEVRRSESMRIVRRASSARIEFRPPSSPSGSLSGHEPTLAQEPRSASAEQLRASAEQLPASAAPVSLPAPARGRGRWLAFGGVAAAALVLAAYVLTRGDAPATQPVPVAAPIAAPAPIAPPPPAPAVTPPPAPAETVETAPAAVAAPAPVAKPVAASKPRKSAAKPKPKSTTKRKFDRDGTMDVFGGK